jgi:hypothetical protein
VAVIRAVGQDGLTVTPLGGRQAVRVRPGQSLPGAPGLVFRQAVLVKAVEYRHRPVERRGRKTLNGELYLVGVTGGRAILQRDVDPPPSPTEVMENRLAAVRIVEAGPRTWEVSAGDVQVAMESGEAIIADAVSNSRLDLSGEGGIGLEIKTPLADVRLDGRGFLITSPNLARRAGLQMGDRILQVDGVPIDGLARLVQVYRSLRRDVSRRVIQVTIERGQQPLTLTYRVR